MYILLTLVISNVYDFLLTQNKKLVNVLVLLSMQLQWKGLQISSKKEPNVQKIIEIV